MKVDMHRMFIRQSLFMLLLLPKAYGANAQDLKVLISADMEGVAGAVTQAQMGPSGFEYSQFRKFMTAEVNVAIEGPLSLDLTYKNDKAAELIAYLPNVELINNHTVRYVGNSIEISMFIEMALGYPSTLS